jgi:ribosomal protein S18 acetylase RimI-like enzyme/ubiquinone/menaquinone biosynthesis C-methylase UbiE
MTDVRRTYDSIAAEYRRRVSGELDHKPFDRALLDSLAGRVRGQAWDLGCGPGHVAAHLRGRGVDVVGFDLSAAMVAEARRLHPEITFEVADFADLPTVEPRPAAMVAFYSLIHLPPAAIPPVLVYWRSRLAPGGLLLVAVHAGDEVIHLDEWWDTKVSIDTWFHDPQRLKRWVEEAGFTVDALTLRDPYPDVEYPSRRAYLLATAPAADGITIRDYREADAADVNRLAVAAFEQFRPHYVDWNAMAAGVGRMSALAASGEILIAEDRGAIAGAVAYIPPHRPKAEYFDAAWPIIRMLVVDPAARGRGIGRALTDACIARARRDGAAAIALHTSAIMTVALAMYRRLGFEPVREAPPIHGVPYAVYVKPLTPG